MIIEYKIFVIWLWYHI